ncbi:MAG: hypothetical protein A3K11_07815 [Nitrospirae bacterium RIFCSPLOWO2_12_FULL_63_8]|nr:MAG: hypothetical protein A3K11_07815 [Nitrospirae bacterium RIFCSPLOWO2_12_FULL_63_8]
MAFAQSELRVGRELVDLVQVQEMLVLDDRFRVVFPLEERLGPLDDDVGVVVFLDGVAEEDLLVGGAEGLAGLSILGRFRLAGAPARRAHGQDGQQRQGRTHGTR